MKSKIITLLFALTLSIVFTGCGRSHDDVLNDKMTSQETTDSEENSNNIDKTTKDNNEETAIEANDTEAAAEADDTNLQSSAAILDIITHHDLLRFEDDDYYYGTMFVDGLYVLDDEHEALSQALQEEALEAKKDLDSFKDTSLEDEEFLKEHIKPNGLKLDYENEISIIRNDPLVTSYTRLIFSDLGGAHPSHYYFGYNYDTATGSKLELEDVITDIDEFKSVLLEKLNEKSDDYMFFEEWKDSFEAGFDKSNSDYFVDFVLTNNGVDIIYNTYELAPYASGVIWISINYDSYSYLFNPQYIYTNTDFCKMLEYDELGDLSYSYDFNNDNKDEKLVLSINRNSYYDEYSDSYYEDGASITVNYGNKEYILEAEIDFDSAYIMRSSNSNYYLYIQTSGNNDWKTIDILNISNPDEGPVYVGYNKSGAFYNALPVDTQHIAIFNRCDVLGTYGVYTECYVDDNGYLTPYSPEYYITAYKAMDYFKTSDDYYRDELVLKRDLSVVVADDFNAINSGESETLKKGTKLYPYCTDMKETMILKLEDGRFAKVKYDKEQDPDTWEKCIDGEPESEIFDGIMYAG